MLILDKSVDEQVRTSWAAKPWICAKLRALDLSFGAALDFLSAKFWICLSLDPHSLGNNRQEVGCAIVQLLYNRKEIKMEKLSWVKSMNQQFNNIAMFMNSSYNK